MLRCFASNQRPPLWRFLRAMEEKYNSRIVVLQKYSKRRLSKTVAILAPASKDNMAYFSAVPSLANQKEHLEEEDNLQKVIINELGEIIHENNEVGPDGKPLSERMKLFRHKLQIPMDNLKFQVHPHSIPDDVPEWPNGVNPHTGEVGGPKGLEPTRYGDWEYNGIACDF